VTVRLKSNSDGRLSERDLALARQISAAAREQGTPVDMDGPRPQRNRIHIDVYVPHDQAEARVTAAIAAGGHVVSDNNAPGWWTLADAKGNEVEIASWPDRD
jgi:hypothetical protein